MRHLFRLAVKFCALIALFSGILHAAEPIPAAHYNVRDFGAVGDGKNLDSPAIDRAIQAAAAAGGGTVLLPAGTYLSGSIHLQSNINLHLSAGATILGAPQEMNAYDETEVFTGIAYQDGGHTYFRNSLIWGENLTNVSITGQGMIDGAGLTIDSSLLDKMCGFGTGLPADTNAYPPVRLGNKALTLKLCKNVLIRDITIVHGGHFAILATGCDNLTIDNVTIDTNRDGIDLDACRNTVVSNCRVNSPTDDAIVPKSSYALGEPRITENLTITNCQVSGFAEGTLLDGTHQQSKYRMGRIKLGTESSGGFRNVTISNCTFRNCKGLALEMVDGGIMENITVTNLTMMDVDHYAIYITTGSRNRTPNLTTPSRMRNILISNVIADSVGKMNGIHISGLPDVPLEGIRLDNIRLTSKGGGTKEHAAIKPKELGNNYPEPWIVGILPAYGIYARNVRDLELANISVDFEETDYRPAADFSNIQYLEIDNFKAELAEGVKAAIFAPDVKQIVIRNSPVLTTE